MDRDYPELRKSNDYFLENLDSFLKSHYGEYALVHDSSVIGFFPSLEEALKVGSERFPIGSFLVKQVVPENEKLVYTSFRVSYT